MSTLEIEPGDAAEPYRCRPDDFPQVTFKIDTDRWPHTVVVAGGLQFAECELEWVVGRFCEATMFTTERNQLHVECAPTQGAASLIYKHAIGMLQPVGMTWLHAGYGRAAEFRCAWDLLRTADSAVVFEPFDAIARHVVHYAPQMETRWRRGIPVRRIGARERK